MSSTYAIREIDRIFKTLSERNYTYKEAAINTRTPENEADEMEKDFILRLNENEELMRMTATREIDGERYFQVLRRGETMESSCLKCHSMPEAASGQLVERYGAQRSFFREKGEVISAISILVPLDYLTSRYGSRLVRIIIVLLGLSLLIGIVTVRLNKKYITGPLEEIRNRAFAAARNPGYVVTDIDLRYSREINDLASSINSLSSRLNHHINNLDILVRERTDRLEKLLSEKDFLMKELNHRVKNNLLMVSSLIGLKDAALGEKAGLTHVGFPEYVEELLAGAFAVAQAEIIVEKEIEIESLHQKTIVPLGLRLVSALVEQIEGTIELQRSPHPVFKIRFPSRTAD